MLADVTSLGRCEGVSRRPNFITNIISINSYRSDVRVRRFGNQRGGFVRLWTYGDPAGSPFLYRCMRVIFLPCSNDAGCAAYCVQPRLL